MEYEEHLRNTLEKVTSRRRRDIRSRRSRWSIKNRRNRRNTKNRLGGKQIQAEGRGEDDGREC